jgi:quinol monooxygenase YgiN
MDKKQDIAERSVVGRRSFAKAAGIGGCLALAGGSTEVFAAAAGNPDTCCSLAPYFEVNEGKLEEFKALGPKFVELTSHEQGVLYYAFSFDGKAAHCREGYKDAAALLAHLKNVDAVLKQALAISKITRLEVHGPAAELDKLREPLKGLSPQYFALAQGGFRR